MFLLYNESETFLSMSINFCYKVDLFRQFCDLTWLMLCWSKWSVINRPLLFSSVLRCRLHLFSVVFETCCPRNFSSSFFTRCSLTLSLSLCGLMLCTVVLVWQCCYCLFSVCVWASFIFFYLSGPSLALGQFSCAALNWWLGWWNWIAVNVVVCCWRCCSWATDGRRTAGGTQVRGMVAAERHLAVEQRAESWATSS